MKQYNKNKGALFLVGVFIFFSMFWISFVSAEQFNLTDSSSNVVQFKQLKYEPYPVIPGEYFEIWIAVQGKEKSSDWVFELVPEYPFSLNLNENPVSDYGDSDFSSIVLKYKIKVAEDSFDGTYDLKLKYDYNGIEYYKIFKVDVEDSRTAFDAVIQESTSSEVSIAIANTGKYAANSVVVRIPEQEGFKATGTDGQMVGNLDAGDYTIVSFSITSMMQRNSQTSDSKRDFQTSDSKEDSQTSDFKGDDKDVIPNFQNQGSNLQFDIYYTDALGERRIVNMELPLQMTSTLLTEGGEMPEGFQGRNMGQQDSGINWTFWIIIVVLIIGGFILYKKYPEQTKEFYTKSKQKTKRLFNKKKQANNTSNVIPDWIKNDKNQEKKK